MITDIEQAAENWVNHKEFKRYEMSSFGQIRNISTSKILKSAIDKKGYLQINLLRNDGVNKCSRVHRLIIETFLPIANSNSFHVNHINGIKTDNRIENLEWCTASENQIHSYRVLKRNPSDYILSTGEGKGNSKLTEKDVIEFYEHLKNGRSVTSFAVSRNLNSWTLRNIIGGATWTYLKIDWSKVHKKYSSKYSPIKK